MKPEEKSFLDKDFKDTGFRKSKTTAGFRALNFELFVKPVSIAQKLCEKLSRRITWLIDSWHDERQH